MRPEPTGLQPVRRPRRPSPMGLQPVVDAWLIFRRNGIINTNALFIRANMHVMASYPLDSRERWAGQDCNENPSWSVPGLAATTQVASETTASGR